MWKETTGYHWFQRGFWPWFDISGRCSIVLYPFCHVVRGLQEGHAGAGSRSFGRQVAFGSAGSLDPISPLGAWLSEVQKLRQHSWTNIQEDVHLHLEWVYGVFGATVQRQVFHLEWCQRISSSFIRVSCIAEVRGRSPQR